MSSRSTETPPDDTQKTEQKSVFRDYAETILVCVIFVIFARSFVFMQSKIPSGSMEDTLLVGDYIMVNRFVYSPTVSKLERLLLPQREVRRGDIIVFRHTLQPEVDYIKRVIGLPGDRLEFFGGNVYRNGERLDEPYVKPRYRVGSPEIPAVVVPDGHYFVMGDHRNSSSDSREWGPLPAKLVKGRAFLIWWSFDESNPEAYPTWGERMRAWGEKAIHIFGRSRWSRCFNIIR